MVKSHLEFHQQLLLKEPQPKIQASLKLVLRLENLKKSDKSFTSRSLRNFIYDQNHDLRDSRGSEEKSRSPGRTSKDTQRTEVNDSLQDSPGEHG